MYHHRIILPWVTICCLMIISLFWLTWHSTVAVFAFVDHTAPAQQDTTIPTELLVFDLDRPITTADRGFPRNDPPRAEANGDWTQPINFAEGTLHLRVAIRSQPTPQAMRIQFCIWQDNFRLETCAPLADVSGAAGTVVTWSKPIPEMWVKNKPIDWTRPRQRYGFAIKNSQNQPVSDYSGWNWNGEDPNAWYPLDARLTVVVVAKGESFSGWHTYIEGLPTPTATTVEPTATAVIPPTETPEPTPQPTATATLTSIPSATATPAVTSTPTATVPIVETATPTVMPTVTPSPTPSATTAPNGSDPFEPDNSCETARPIATDASQQERTVHQATDIDWVRFAVAAGNDYRIRVNTEEPLNGAILIDCAGTPLFTVAAITEPDFRLDFAAPTTGTAYVRIEYQDPARSMNGARYTLSIRQLLTDGNEPEKIFLPVVIR